MDGQLARHPDLLLLEAQNLTCEPDATALTELRALWSWLLPDIFTPTVFSALGDMIFEDASGQVHWLNTGTAQVSVAASSTVEFWRNLNGDLLDELFLPPLIKQLRKAGKILGPNQCYSYTTLPIFAQGSYSVENIYVLSCREHFGVTGGIHRQIRDMPDGQKSTA